MSIDSLKFKLLVLFTFECAFQVVTASRVAMESRIGKVVDMVGMTKEEMVDTTGETLVMRWDQTMDRVLVVDHRDHPMDREVSNG